MTDHYIIYVSVAFEKYHSPECKHDKYIYKVFANPSMKIRRLPHTIRQQSNRQHHFNKLFFSSCRCLDSYTKTRTLFFQLNACVLLFCDSNISFSTCKHTKSPVFDYEV